mgnify:CR=1 FL=1
MQRKIMLNNRISIPPIGYGVFCITDQKECEDAVLNALSTLIFPTNALSTML